MGVPVFFAWLLARYPNIRLSPGVIPTLDNIYIDLNAAIHTICRNPPGTEIKPVDQMYAEVWGFICDLVE
jgi:5'-3' exonuclease